MNVTGISTPNCRIKIRVKGYDFQMAVYITFKFGNTEFSDKIDLSEAQSLETRAEQTREGRSAYRLVFGNDIDGTTRNILGTEIVNAIDILIDLCQSRGASYVYSVAISKGFVMSGVSSGVGGLRVGDTIYGIIGGLDQCTLITFKQNDQGEWVKAAEEDARQLGSLKTDNLGVVKIRKRATPTGLLQLLKRIRKRLVPVDRNTMIGVTVG